MLSIAIVLMVLGVAFPAFFIATQNDANVPFMFSYLRHANIVSPVQVSGTIDPNVIAQIRTHPATAHVAPAKPLSLMASAGWGEIGVSMYAMREDDMRMLMDVYGMHVGDGRLPHSRSNEIVLSQAVALNRGLRVGDKVGQPVYERDGIPTEMVVVGILEPDRSQSRSEQAKRPFSYAPQWLGFASYEYMEGHERYAAVPTHFLAVPVAGREAELEAWLEEKVDSPQVEVKTFNTSYQFARDAERNFFLFYAVAETIVAAAAAVALAVLNYIYFAQRREEFGTLHAVGYSRAWLVLRALRESVSVVSVAWVIGAALCAAGLLYVQANIYAPKGISINLYNPWPWLFTLPIPLAVVAASVGTLVWILSRLDPISIIERR
jgi:putative ABC transport system permease protein